MYDIVENYIITIVLPMFYGTYYGIPIVYYITYITCFFILLIISHNIKYNVLCIINNKIM